MEMPDSVSSAKRDHRSLFPALTSVSACSSSSPQPVGFPPLRDQEPAIVFPFTVPVSVLPPGDPDTTLTSKWPVTLPLKSPGDPIKL